MQKKRSNLRVVSVRKARSSDREAVFKFCRKIFKWGDYIPHVWDSWLNDKHGRLFVATINNVPVGISHLSLDKHHDAWLSGARTNPDYRRVGIATAITKKSLQYAKRKGARKARLLTSSENTAAQTVIQKLGFEPIAEFVEMKTKKKEKNEKRRQQTLTMGRRDRPSLEIPANIRSLPQISALAHSAVPLVSIGQKRASVVCSATKSNSARERKR